MTRLHIVHTTSFIYDRPAAASYNEARMRPATLPGQMVLSSRLSASPSTWSTEYRDYWGTQVTAFEVLRTHSELVVTSESTVDLQPRPDPGATGVAERVEWSTLTEPSIADRLAEFLANTEATAPSDELAALALECGGGRSPVEAALAVCEAVRSAVEYVPGVTGVHTRAAEAWAQRSGVCQDIAHLVLGALRSLGIPARYVSGYLHPLGHEAVAGETFLGESHAWIEFWCGEWYPWDPTNRCAVSDHHVVVARGREYNDVTPLRGVFAGGGQSQQSVQVALTLEA
ncbi:transglutaminase family protein [Serinibacter salmoneus]|uniref:Transglutaminase-like putative cysteine protease n=1 Tax=Serinibacter salmoneus TaxID=556530 RepID=A0A2A9D259_9MICO|nr:transglutaminase family protein [Serinibacter salmoneus]PFG20032.1 transglutaminase-like putative cysteine protease [Serinibacter salmoneus]